MNLIKKILKPIIPAEILLLRRRLLTNFYVQIDAKICEKKVNEYLLTHDISKLQLGTSKNILENWFNTDKAVNKNRNVYYLDVTKTFPIKDKSFKYVFCEELIEHIDYKEGLQMLNECFRILKPGGIIRIGTPNLESFIEMYRTSESELYNDYIKWITDKYLADHKIYSSVFVINNLFRNWDHKFIYDFDTLAGSLKKAGFTNITRYTEGESNHHHLKNIDQHGISSSNKKFRNLESFFAEAEKPL